MQLHTLPPLSRRSLLSAAALALGLGCSLAQAAADWPSQTLKLVVGFPAGSSPDLTARALAEPLGKALGQTVIVENKVGAGGNMYKGDLSDWNLLPKLAQLKTMNTAVDFQVRFQPKQAFAYRAKLTFTGIDGDGANNPLPTVLYSTKSFSYCFTSAGYEATAFLISAITAGWPAAIRASSTSSSDAMPNAPEDKVETAAGIVPGFAAFLLRGLVMAVALGLALLASLLAGLLPAWRARA